MSNPDALATLLFNIFQSDHDIAIVGSTVPRRRTLNCESDSESFGCDGEFFEAALKKLYAHTHDRASLEESVIRILQWKYDMYLNLTRHHSTSDNMRSGSHEFLSAFLAGGIRYEPGAGRDHASISEELDRLSTKVFHSAVSLVARPDSSREVNLARSLELNAESKVLCVGPSYSKNDLKAALKKWDLHT